MKIVKIYEEAESDGRSTYGIGRYHLNKDIAKAMSKINSKDWGHDAISHDCIDSGNGEYFILKSVTPVKLQDDSESKKTILNKVLSKLTDEEKQILGLK